MKQKIKQLAIKLLRNFKWYQSRESMVNYGFFSRLNDYKHVKLFGKWLYLYRKDKYRNLYVWEDKFGELFLATSRWSKRTNLDGNHDGLDFFSRGTKKTELSQGTFSWEIESGISIALKYHGIDTEKTEYETLLSTIGSEISAKIADAYRLDCKDMKNYKFWTEIQGEFLEDSKWHVSRRKFELTEADKTEVYYYGKKIWDLKHDDFSKF